MILNNRVVPDWELVSNCTFGYVKLKHMRWLWCLCLLTMLACGTEEQVANEKQEWQQFFDLEGFINAEVERLNAEQTQLRKKVVFNNSEEEHLLSEVDFERELAPFQRADINRPAWSDAYEADTTLTNGAITRISYQCTDDKMRTKLLVIDFNADETVAMITAHTKAVTGLSSSEQALRYEPARGYSIDTHQTSLAGEDTDLGIAVSFQK